MFQNLRTPHEREENFKDMDLNSSKRGFHKSPGTTSSVIKGNETRLIRCVHCGWLNDTERELILDPESWAGLGISYSAPLTATTCVSDAIGANGAKKADTYYERTVAGGCGCCGSFLYDRKPQDVGEVQ